MNTDQRVLFIFMSNGITQRMTMTVLWQNRAGKSSTAIIRHQVNLLVTQLLVKVSKYLQFIGKAKGVGNHQQINIPTSLAIVHTGAKQKQSGHEIVVENGGFDDLLFLIGQSHGVNPFRPLGIW